MPLAFPSLCALRARREGKTSASLRWLSSGKALLKKMLSYKAMSKKETLLVLARYREEKTRGLRWGVDGMSAKQARPRHLWASCSSAGTALFSEVTRGPAI